MILGVKFYDRVDDELLEFAVIIATSGGKWVFCKHRERDTLEVPGGHREPGESADEAAARELREETGAVDYTLTPICVYAVERDSGERCGMLYCAEIRSFERELHSEIERVELLDELPTNWTYPDIQPALIAEAQRRGIV